MKKFLFVALLGGALVACNDTASTTSSEDSARIADSIKNATAPVDTATTTPMMADTSAKMMADTASSMMSADSAK